MMDAIVAPSPDSLAAPPAPAAAKASLERLAAALHEHVRTDARDLTLRQLGVLLLLAGEGERRTVRGLAAALAIQKPVVTRCADRLASLGLVRRLPDPVDGRSVLLAATAAGRRLVAGLAAAMRRPEPSPASAPSWRPPGSGRGGRAKEGRV